ncbi:alanine dehydrogenase [Intestinimonas sp. HCP28S3_D6]|uniref:alanine dehydrogenase n=1 Tax=Intestinimonas sp. HCP28S3_D6 TaxID=3438942 RepID=UPI003F893EB9
MLIGIPMEVKPQEFRVALTPAGTDALVRAGHRVVVQNSAGLGSGFTDEEYIDAGAQICDDPEEIFRMADMIVKVKEPQEEEYALLRPGQTLFTYLHLAPNRALTRAMLESRVTGIAYETVQLADGSLPLLAPMSEVAGRMSIQVGARLLEQTTGGRGVLLGGVPGVESAHVAVIGGGTVGTNAVKMAVGLGAQVTVVDVSIERLTYLDDLFQGRVITLASNPYNIARATQWADLVVGAVLIPGGAIAPRLITEEMVRQMRPGSVIIDVAVDQGGIVETIDHTTTHQDPTYVKHGVIHYAVSNMPGAVPRTSTFALTNATLPYIRSIADHGAEETMRLDPTLRKGLNTYMGKLTLPSVGEIQGLPSIPSEALF